MFDFRPDPATPKPEAYSQLLDAAEALTAGEPDAVANMANIAALLWDFLPDLNWSGDGWKSMTFAAARTALSQ